MLHYNKKLYYNHARSGSGLYGWNNVDAAKSIFDVVIMSSLCDGDFDVRVVVFTTGNLSAGENPVLVFPPRIIV